MKDNVKLNVVLRKLGQNTSKEFGLKLLNPWKWHLPWIIWLNPSLWMNLWQYLRALKAIKHQEKSQST
jgi:hypothetical protein